MAELPKIMVRYEYQIVGRNDDEPMLLETLNQLGKLGWELCAIYPTRWSMGDASWYWGRNYHFKRLVLDDEKNLENGAYRSCSFPDFECKGHAASKR